MTISDLKRVLRNKHECSKTNMTAPLWTKGTNMTLVGALIFVPMHLGLITHGGTLLFVRKNS